MNVFKEAKKIQRQHPRMDWQTAIKKASVKVKRASKTLGSRRAKPMRKPARKKAVAVKTRVTSERVIVTRSAGAKMHGMTTAQLKSALKGKLKTQIDHLVVRRYHAPTKTAKRKLNKQLTAIRTELRKL